MEYPKLVRDKIPQIIKQNDGIDVPTKIASDDGEFLDYLLKKMIEESTELSNAPKEGNLEEEMADIFEVIDAILKLKKQTVNDIAVIQKEKREKRGGFDERIIMLRKQ
jgi:predicted house-cleaning noncanonical NTP pyrophosphatase (MazG superfamily)